jgi:hypothetical protein
MVPGLLPFQQVSNTVLPLGVPSPFNMMDLILLAARKFVRLHVPLNVPFAPSVSVTENPLATLHPLPFTQTQLKTVLSAQVTATSIPPMLERPEVAFEIAQVVTVPVEVVIVVPEKVVPNARSGVSNRDATSPPVAADREVRKVLRNITS